MPSHHRSNKEVEGNPDTGHGRGMPVRPDEEELEERTEEDREEVGEAPDPEGSSEKSDEAAEQAEVDRQVERGEVRTDAKVPRKDRDPFPPSHYDR